MYFVTLPPVGFTFIHNGRLAKCLAASMRTIAWEIECEKCSAVYRTETKRDFSRVSRCCSDCDNGQTAPASQETVTTMRALAKLNKPEAVDAVRRAVATAARKRHWVSAGGTIPADWFGYEIATMLGLSAAHDRYAIKAAIEGFIENGVLEVYEGRDASRKRRQFLRAGIMKPKPRVDDLF